MFNRRGPSGRNSPPCPSDEEAKEKLKIYVYEYLHHAGAKNAAETFLKECGMDNRQIDLSESPGFLRQWWSVFWDLYCAAPERRDNCEHSKEAKAFHDFRMDGAAMPLVNGMHPGAVGSAGPGRFIPGPGRGGPPNMAVSRDGSMPPFSGPQTSGGPPGPMFADPNSQVLRPGMPMMQPGVSNGGPQRLPPSNARMPSSYQPGLRQAGPPRWPPTSSGMPYSVPSPGGAGPFPPAMVSMSNGPNIGNPVMTSPQPFGAPPQYGNDGRFMMGPGGMPGPPYGPGPPETSQPGSNSADGLMSLNGPGGGGGPSGGLGGPGTPSSGVHSSTPTTSSANATAGSAQQQPGNTPGPTPNQMDMKSSPSSSHGGGALNNGGTPLNAGNAGPASVGQVGTPGGSATNPATPQPSAATSTANATNAGTPVNHTSNGPPSVPTGGGNTAVQAGRSSVPPATEHMDCSGAPAFADVAHFQERDQSEIAKIKASMMEETKQFEPKSEGGDFFPSMG